MNEWVWSNGGKQKHTHKTCHIANKYIINPKLTVLGSNLTLWHEKHSCLCLLRKICQATNWHKSLVCLILLCWKVWQETVEIITRAIGRIMWTCVLDPAPSMKENRWCDNEMWWAGEGGYCDFYYSQALFFCYMQGTENAVSPAGWIVPPQMKYRGEFKENKTCRWWYNRLKRAGRNMERSAFRNKEGGKRNRWNW
jgi:hypothetical protein